MWAGAVPGRQEVLGGGVTPPQQRQPLQHLTSQEGKPEEEGAAEEEDEEEADITGGGKGHALLPDFSRTSAFYSISSSAAAPVVLMINPALDHFSLLTERSRSDTEPIAAL